MKSKTKHYINNNDIDNIFNNAKLGTVENISILDAGEFNTAYFVKANSKDYVLKIAPINNDNALTYEHDLMGREVDFYKIIQAQTDVRTPEIFFYDKSKSIISAEYFIMERLTSIPLNECNLNRTEKESVYEKVGEMAAKLHNIKGEGFGYVQNGLEQNWYLAIKKMTVNLLNDCKKYKKRAANGEKLLRYIEKNKSILENVESAYTHFDIWDGNIFYDGATNTIALIDTERGFWGDCLADFVNIELFKTLDKKSSVKEYNKTALNRIVGSKEEIIRYNIMLAYLGLVVFTERFARYKLSQRKYYVNKSLSKILFSKAFKALKTI